MLLDQNSKQSCKTNNICLNNSISKHKNHKLRSASQTASFILLFILIGLLIIYPLSLLIIRSLSIDGNFSISNYMSILKDSGSYIAVGHTLYVAIGAFLLTSLFGGSMAWLVTRTDYPFKKIVDKLCFLTFIIPSYILAISWIEIFGRNGFLSKLLKSTSLIDQYTFSPYSLGAVIIVLSIHLYPLMYMSIKNAFMTLDPSLEQAAILSGASRLKATLTISLPLIAPSFISVGLLIFSRTMANFGVAAVLALPVGKEVLTTRIYSTLTNLEINQAIALSIILVALSGTIFVVQQRKLHNMKFTTQTSESQKPKLLPLGKLKLPVIIIVVTFQCLTTVIPLISIISASFLKRWGLSFTLDHLTLNNYKALIFDHPLMLTALKNSLLYGALAASFAALLALLIVSLNTTSNSKLGKLMEMIACWPMAFPNIVLAVAATLAWTKPPLKFYGTPWILIITYTTLFLPIAIKNISGLAQNQDPTLEQAAILCGASPIKAFKDITFPMLLPGVKSGWILGFIISLREIPIALLLYSAGTETLGILLFGLQSSSYGLEMTSTLAVVIIVLTGFLKVLASKMKTFKGGQ
jgi:iron(III) transport system permease protein